VREIGFALFVTLGVFVSACGGTQSQPTLENIETDDMAAGVVLSADPALEAIVPASYRIERLRGGFTFTEGPVWVDNGARGSYLLFSDIPENAIYRWTLDGTVTEFLKPVYEETPEEGRSVGPSGLTLDANGRIVMAEHGYRRISRLEKDGSRTVLASEYEGKRLNSPDDLVYHSNGSLYFTDPPYGLLQQDSDPAKELPFNGIFRLSPDGTLTLLNRSQTRPNGLAFSPDEKTLYVSNSDPSLKVWMAYTVKDDGTLSEGRVFFDVSSETSAGLPDGLKVDKLGNVYATGPGGVWIFTPEGKHLGTIQPEEVPENAAWGEDGLTLYMTARTGIYRIRLLAEGIRR
jgi:gluconolactonase